MRLKYISDKLQEYETKHGLIERQKLSVKPLNFYKDYIMKKRLNDSKKTLQDYCDMLKNGNEKYRIYHIRYFEIIEAIEPYDTLVEHEDFLLEEDIKKVMNDQLYSMFQMYQGMFINVKEQVTVTELFLDFIKILTSDDIVLIHVKLCTNNLLSDSIKRVLEKNKERDLYDEIHRQYCKWLFLNHKRTSIHNSQEYIYLHPFNLNRLDSQKSILMIWSAIIYHKPYYISRTLHIKKPLRFSKSDKAKISKYLKDIKMTYRHLVLKKQIQKNEIYSILNDHISLSDRDTKQLFEKYLNNNK